MSSSVSCSDRAWPSEPSCQDAVKRRPLNRDQSHRKHWVSGVHCDEMMRSGSRVGLGTLKNLRKNFIIKHKKGHEVVDDKLVKYVTEVLSFVSFCL